MFTRARLVVMFLMVVLVGTAFCGTIGTPIGHWTFDEASGTIAHDSAGNHDGTLMNGTLWSAGHIGGAVEFDGVNDYVKVLDAPDLDGMQQITLSAWINIHTWKSGEGARIISKRTLNSQDSYEMAIDTSLGYPNMTANFYCQSAGSGLNAPPNTIGLNQWYHIVGTNNGYKQILYINGIEVKSANVTTGPIRSTTADLWFGQVTDAWRSTAFDGLIDDIRIYDYALSASEVLELYQIPEPTTAILLGMGIFGLLKRK